MMRIVLAAASLAIWSPAALSQDAAHYNAACGACHPSAPALARKIAGATLDEKKARLVAFLQNHHKPDPAKLDGIVAYLLPAAK